MTFNGDTPCRSCTPETGRHLKCHDECEAYLAWRKEKEKEKEIIRKKRALDANFETHRKDQIWKYYKGHKR